MVSKKGQGSSQACEMDLWLIIGLREPFLLGVSCKKTGLRSLISCLLHLNVPLYQRGAFLKHRNGGCFFDDDWACPPLLETDDNLQCMCLGRECQTLDCHLSLYLSVYDRRIGTSDFRTALLQCSFLKVSQYCLSLELCLHSCGVRNYTVGLKQQNPLFGLDLATECSAL